MRALGSKVELETRYGGRFVQSIDGLAGSLEDQRDWFWFVNGYEGDRSASAYRLRDGDVAWLDYRGWEREGEARVVVGAFPEPFLHGYDGRDAACRRSLRRLADAGGAAGPHDRRRRRSSRSERRSPAMRTCSSSATGRIARPPSCSARPPVTPSSSSLSGDPALDAQVRGAMSPVPAAALLAAAGTAALLTDRLWAVATLTAVLLADLPARARRASRRLPVRGALEQPRRAPALAVPLVGPGRNGPLGGADASRSSGRST